MWITVLTLALVAATWPAQAFASSASTYVWGPGCPNEIGASAPINGTWYTISDGDYNGYDWAGHYCSGATQWAWTGNTTNEFEWVIQGPSQGSYQCYIWTYIPTDHGGAYAARYDFWWKDWSNNWHWLAWPGHDVDQESLSGWYRLSYKLTFTTQMQLISITLHDDPPNDSNWRYMGAGDMSIADSDMSFCGWLGRF